MRSRTLLYGLLAALEHTASGQVCPPGYGTVNVDVVSYLYVAPVHISTYIPSNTVLNIGPGLTFNVTNAPTNLVTNGLASSILNDLE